VGNGSRVLLWHDVWCGERPLKDHFSDVFRMVCFKDATVNHVVSWNGDQSHWNITFSRSPYDWEKESVLNLLALLAKVVGDDMILWHHDSKKKFTIKSFYREVCNGSSSIDFPVVAICRSKALSKLAFWLGPLPRGKCL